MSSTYIFGHRNPDTDTVCSAIALSYLKNQMGENTIPKVLGHINEETKYALEAFQTKEPDYLNNVKVQLRNVHYKKGVMIRENASVKEVVDYMLEKSLTAVPVVDERKHLVSLITLKEIAMLFIENPLERLNTSYEHIIDALKGKEILRFRNEFDGELLAGSYQSQTFVEQAKLTKNHILIVGDRYKVIKHGIESGVALIILTNKVGIAKELLELAKQNQVSIISSSYDTYRTCNQIALSSYVSSILINRKPSTVHELDYLSDFITESTKLGFTNYPILNRKNECLGLIRIPDIGHYEKKKVILVDHNNLGAIGTTTPINFRCMPVGCTSTILYGLFKENKVRIPKNIAGLMLSSILSDTLILKSPTTTYLDKEAVENLAKIAGVDYKDYGYQMLKAGSSIKGKTIEDIIYQDYKTYKVGTESLGISQVITMDFEELKPQIPELVEELNQIAKVNLSTVTLFVTDIVKNGSYVLYNTSAKHIIEDSFDLNEVEEGTFLNGMVPRKKQILPAIMEVLGKK